MQQQTLLGPNTKFKTVPLISGADDIAFVAIERGSKEFPTDSDTGVALSIGAQSNYLVVDDLTYDPPASPTGKQLPARGLAADRPSCPRDEIAADQSPGHLDREPEPVGQPSHARTECAAGDHRHLHAESDRQRTVHPRP